MAPVSERRKASRNAYDAEHFEYITLKVPKGHKSVIDDVAQAQGLSRNKFIQEAIDERIKQLRR